MAFFDSSVGTGSPSGPKAAHLALRISHLGKGHSIGFASQVSQVELTTLTVTRGAVRTFTAADHRVAVTAGAPSTSLLVKLDLCTTRADGVLPYHLIGTPNVAATVTLGATGPPRVRVDRPHSRLPGVPVCRP